MTKHGRERRRRFVYITKNSEYHVFDGICVAIKSKRTGAWVDRHAALTRRLEGGVKMLPSGAAVPTLGAPEIGDPMYFQIDDDRDEQVITSRVIAVDRPRPDDLVRYPAA
jgi:hypothetical protein